TSLPVGLRYVMVISVMAPRNVPLVPICVIADMGISRDRSPKAELRNTPSVLSTEMYDLGCVKIPKAKITKRIENDRDSSVDSLSPLKIPFRPARARINSKTADAYAAFGFAQHLISSWVVCTMEILYIT